MKVKVLDDISKNFPLVSKSLEWAWNEVLEPRLDSSAAQSA